jgi:hypothetical protein
LANPEAEEATAGTSYEVGEDRIGGGFYPKNRPHLFEVEKTAHLLDFSCRLRLIKDGTKREYYAKRWGKSGEFDPISFAWFEWVA